MSKTIDAKAENQVEMDSAAGEIPTATPGEDVPVHQKPLRIAFYIEPSQWGDLSPEDLEPGGRGLGGRETCLIYVAAWLAEFGHEVTVYAPTAEARQVAPGLRWLPFREAYAPTIRAADAAVSFSGPWVWANNGIPGKVQIIEEQCAHLRTGRAAQLVDRFFVLSRWQAWHLAWIEPEIHPDRIVAIPNGIDLRRYNGAAGERDPHRIFYSSSPDRGLHHLLEAWPAIRAAVPDARLEVFYEVESWLEINRWAMLEQGRRAVLIERLRDQPGIRFYGMVDPWVLARKQQECELWAYPADLLLGTETFCITGLEAAAAGCSMLTTTADCLPEIYGEVAAMAELPLDVAGFGEAAIQLLTEPELADRFRPGISFAEAYTWERVARQWEREIGRALAGEPAAGEGD